jgi:tripartite-type tricarboxylate transporter receptor subunit TctC
MGEMYKAATGIQTVEVPYRTANDSLNDFASGRLDFGMMDPVFALSQARAGRLRNLAVSTPQRMQAVPELPTMAEAGVPWSCSPGSPPWCPPPRRGRSSS